jgi:hypothetical protein
VRTKECKELIEKYKDDSSVVSTFKQRQYPYSKKDFSDWIVTEKDIEFLNDLSQESYQWILVKSINSNGIRTNCFYSKSISQYLPNFDFSNVACIFKVDMVVPLPVRETFDNLAKANLVEVSFLNNSRIFLQTKTTK